MLLKGKQKKHLSEKSSIQLQCYLLIALPLIGFFIFTIYPMSWVAYRSFTFYDLIPGHERFVGLQNYVTALTNLKYWRTWGTLLEFTLIKVPMEIAIALVLATVLNNKLKGSGFFRASFFMPTIISAVIVGVVFCNIFSYFGFVNHWMTKIGMISQPIEWFASKWAAMTVLIVGSIWMNFGTNVLYFTAALTNVPEELYEAAEVDGAGKVIQFFKITLPMIIPVFQTILLLAINGTLQTGEYVIVMTNGAPGGLTHTPMSYLIGEFVPGFASGTVNVGYGTSIAIINSIIYILIAVIYNKATGKAQNLY